MDDRKKKIYKVTLIGTIVNIVLVVLKFVAGILGRSSAMIADAVHSLSDFVSDVIVLIFVGISARPTDKGHEYGHGKFETFATMIIGVILSLAGIGLLAGGIEKIIRSARGEVLPEPGMWALIVAIVSIVMKEALFHYTYRWGKRLNSPSVIANAWHHRSDSISSVGTLVGIAGAMFLGEKFRILDPLAAILVSFFIIKSGWDITRPAVNELLEGSLPEEEEKKILDIINSVDGIYSVHKLRTRRIGNNIAVDFHAQMDGNQTLRQAHDCATRAEKRLMEAYGADTIVNVHMEPAKTT